MRKIARSRRLQNNCRGFVRVRNLVQMLPYACALPRIIVKNNGRITDNVKFDLGEKKVKNAVWGMGSERSTDNCFPVNYKTSAMHILFRAPGYEKLRQLALVNQFLSKRRRRKWCSTSEDLHLLVLFRAAIGPDRFWLWRASGPRRSPARRSSTIAANGPNTTDCRRCGRL